MITLLDSVPEWQPFLHLIKADKNPVEIIVGNESVLGREGIPRTQRVYAMGWFMFHFFTRPSLLDYRSKEEKKTSKIKDLDSYWPRST
jgi:hypothetical protein